MVLLTDKFSSYRIFKPTIIMVTPSYMLSLADSFEKAGIDPRSTSLKIAIHGAEPWTEENACRD